MIKKLSILIKKSKVVIKIINFNKKKPNRDKKIIFWEKINIPNNIQQNLN